MSTEDGSSWVIPSEGDPMTPPNSVTPTPSNYEALEQRFNKLKAITLKYKKQIGDLTAELEGSRDKHRLQNASKIQQEYDKALDEIERLKKSESTLTKDLQKAVDENVKLKMKEADASSQIQSLSSSHKILRDKLDKYETQGESPEELKLRVDALEKELQEAREAGVEAQQEKRLLQILTLEVTDYERKLQDAHGTFEAKKVECDKITAELTQRDKKVDELEHVISNYKDSENKLVLAKESLQADNLRKTEKITFLQDEIGKLNERWNETKSELEKRNQDLESEKSNFLSQSKEWMEKLNISQKLVSSLEQKISLLEENKRSRESQITNLKLEIQQLESDYLNYKNKAQAMLKSHKPITNNDSEELERLQKIIQDFHSEISILKTDLQTCKLENDNLVIERAEINVRLNQLKGDSIEKDVQLNSLVQTLKQQLRESEERFTSQIDSKNAEIGKLAASYQEEIQTLKNKYDAQIQTLRENYEVLKSEKEIPATPEILEDRLLIGNSGEKSFNFQTINADISPSSSETANNISENLHRVSQPLTIDTTTNNSISFDQLRMIPRGEGEGSESVNSISAYTPRLDNYNVSFEQLLSSSFDSVSLYKGSDNENDKTIREALQHELCRSQHQITHLTSVLKESENNCDRLSQLSEALKEEIRRIERDKERQEHLKENTEYLKNVLLKFMTLSGEAERQRLIPVLKTMLKLTNEEVERLEIVTKGGKDGSNVLSIGGWSSYLPHWSGNDQK